MKNFSRKLPKAIFFCLFFLPAFFFEVRGQWQSVGSLLNFQQKENLLEINTSSNAKIQVSFFDLDTIRVRLSKSQSFEPEFSYAFDYSHDRKKPLVKVFQDKTRVVLTNAENAKVVINKNPLLLEIFDKNGNLVNVDASPMSFNRESGEVKAEKKRSNLETYYGFGEKALPFSRDGQFIVNWNTDTYRYGLGTDPLYQSIPFFYTLYEGKSAGVFLNNTYRTFFDTGKSSPNRYLFGAVDGELDYFVFLGNPQQIIESYADLTGKMPLPPLWSLGNQQSRFSYFPENRVREIAEEFRRRKIPADAIYIDIDYMDGFRIFTWDKEKFPNPQKLNQDLEKLGFKSILIINPAIKVDENYEIYRQAKENNFLLKRGDGSIFEGNVWAGKSVFPDFTNPEVRSWFGSLYQKNLSEGVSGFWNDMNEPSVFPNWETYLPPLMNGEEKTLPPDVRHHGDNFRRNESNVRKFYESPISKKQPWPIKTPPLDANHARFHNVYGMQMARSTFEGLKKLAPSKRPFVLSRAGFSGIQRYAAVWTGDNTASWEHLRLSLPMVLNMSVSGVPFIGSDIGGYSDNPSPELFSRWLQSHVLMPLFRPHAEKGTNNKEPWEFGEEFTAINRAVIETRYRFLPYLYTIFYEHEKTGLPVIRPLWFEYPNDRKTYLIDDCYLVGKDILIAPILSANQRKRTVYFPLGDNWRDWQSGEIYQGGSTAEIDVPLEKTPIFARVGSVIPTQPVVQHTGEMSKTDLTLNVIVGIQPDKTEISQIWQDAGDGYGYRLNDWRKFSIEHLRGILRLKRFGSFNGQKIRFIEALGVNKKPSEMRIDGKIVENIEFDEKTKRLKIEIGETAEEITMKP